jgi:hypothetical protein
MSVFAATIFNLEDGRSGPRRLHGWAARTAKKSEEAK